jgi:hypothetical protein
MDQRKSERDPADAASLRPGSRFPISPIGWMGIAAAIVGLAYFVLPEETSEQASERKPPPEARIEVPQTMVNRYEVIAPSARDKSDERRSVAPKSEKAPSPEANAGRSEATSSAPAGAAPEPAPPAATGAGERASAPTEPRKVRATASGPPTLYIHVRDDTQRKWAERMVVPLAQRGIHVAGIKVVTTGPSTRDLRYVGSDEPADAADVAQALRELGVSTQRVRRSDAAEGRASQHYELWLPPGRVEPPS